MSGSVDPRLVRVYPANLCPLSSGVEFASLGEDFGQPIGKPIEAASRRAVWQGSTEHLDCVLSEEQGVDNTIQAGAGRNRWCFRLWGQMSRLRAGQMELALQIIRRRPRRTASSSRP